MTINLVLPTFDNPFSAFWWLFTHGGFLAVIFAILAGMWWLYLDYIQGRFIQNTKYIFLSIDVPRENEQTPKAVEHLFSQLHGIHKNPNRREKYIEGYVQPTVTIELVSIGGFIQFIIRCPEANRDLVEAAIYAQYPNAEVAEVEDYAKDIPTTFPNNDIDIWAAEIVPVAPDFYPIKTYPLWEHSLTQTFLDPMASLLEVMGRLQAGEQIWIQWVLEPNDLLSWREKGLALINKLIGAKSKKKKSTLDSISEAPGAVVQGTVETILRTLMEPGASSTKREKDEPPSLMQHLAPNVRAVVEAVGMKISKIGYKVKGRVVILGTKDVFTRTRVPSVWGALKQYAALDLNGFKPDSKMKTARVWFMVDRRVNALKRKILLGYKYRSIWRGRRTFVLNIEELASLWHFPVITVKAPQVKKTEAKRGEPPVELPVGEEVEYVPKARIQTAPTTAPAPVETPTSSVPPAPAQPPASVSGEPPANLPFG